MSCGRGAVMGDGARSFPRRAHRWAYRSSVAKVCALLAWAAFTNVRAEAPRPVRVLAYNVQFDSTRTTDSLDAVAGADADIACLEELTAPFAGAFEHRFASRFPYRALFPKSGTWGLGIASRFPVSSVHRFAASPSRMPALEATVRTPSGPVLVVCIHLFPPVAKRRAGAGFVESIRDNAALRAAQASHLTRRYRTTQRVVLMGDFNEGVGGEAVKTLRASHFVDACSIPGALCRATWPGPTSPLPALARIDLVLGRGVQFTAAQVPDGGGSDHRPMVASFLPR